MQSLRTKSAWLTATFFGIGLSGRGSGTWASVVTMVVWWLVARTTSVTWQLGIAVFASLVIVLAGIPASTLIEKVSKVHDPGFVVIDEVAGQMIAMIACPLGWKYLLASLILFRGFDILKPPPLRALEKLPGGTGIMLDDVGAGLYAWLVLHVALHLKLM